MTNLEKFIAVVENKYSEYMKQFPNLVDRDTFKTTEGKKYIKVISVGRQTSVYCFIDKSNGNILKANSFNSPHKTPRGNINSDTNGLEALHPTSHYYCIRYLNGGL